MDGFSLILTALVMFLVFLYDRRKRPKTNKQVNSFSECSCTEWSFSDISCSSDSGVVNITITSRRAGG